MKAGQPKPLCPREGVVRVCRYVQWVAIRLEVFATVNGPRTYQLSFISRVTHGYYKSVNTHFAVANVYSAGASHAPLSHWKVCAHTAVCYHLIYFVFCHF